MKSTPGNMGIANIKSRKHSQIKKLEIGNTDICRCPGQQLEHSKNATLRLKMYHSPETNQSLTIFEVMSLTPRQISYTL